MECHECGATISDKAADCPHCGTSVGSPPDRARSPPDDPADADEPSDAWSSTTDGEDDGDGQPADSRPGRSDPSTGDGSDPAEGSQPGQGGPTPAGQQGDTGQSSMGEGGQPASTPADQSGGGPVGSGPAGGSAGSGGSAPGQSTPGQSTPGQSTPGQSTPGQSAPGQSAPGQSGGGAPRGGQQAEPGARSTGRVGDTDLAALVSRMPLFPGAAAGFATAVVVLGLAVAVAAVIPFAGRSTLGQGAGVFFDLHFGTAGHITPTLYGVFEVVRPPASALGVLYLAAPVLVYTASKFVVVFNADESTPVHEAVLGGTTVTLGYLPVAVVALVLAPPSPGLSAVVALLMAGLVYPLLFGALGGFAAGGFSAAERRVGTVYALGVVFSLLFGSFLLTFLTLRTPGGVDILTRVFVTVFTFVGINALGMGGGTNAAILAFVFGLGVVGAAGFVRGWRAAPVDSPPDGFRKGITPAVTYLVVLGVFASAVVVFADDYIQETLEMSFVATSFLDGVVSSGLSSIGGYFTTVVLATLLYPVVVGGVGATIAAAIKSERSSSASDPAAD